MIKELGPGFRLTLVFTILTGTAVSRGDDRYISAHFPEAGERQPGDGERKGCRIEPDRADLLQAGILSSAAVVGRQRIRRDGQQRLESRPDEREAAPRHDENGRQEE